MSNFLKRAAACMLAAMAFGSTASAEDVVTLRWADSLPLTHEASRLSVQPFMKLVEERAGDRIKIQHFPAGQLANAQGILDAVRNGVADIGFVITSLVSDRAGLTMVVELPGLFDDTVLASEALNDLVHNEFLENDYLANGVRPLFAAVTPPYQIMLTSDRPINSPEDLRGLRLRVPGATAELLVDAIGAVPVRMAAGDLYLGLQRGTIDGAILSAGSASAYNLNEVLGQVTTNADFGAVSILVVINERKYQSLPDGVKTTLNEISDVVAGIYAKGGLESVVRGNEYLAKGDVALVELPEPVLGAMAESFEKVHAEWISQLEGRNLPARQTLETFRQRVAQ